ncbi:hypothetical protein AVEN_240023-1 [Araneus ventricosus]|uniref:Uncharacterized protein n=1 Tax=Araneus ventricosus TaxID=182803 RepID=A0A4Y2KIB4_ARAVE|nr:hypothetical protein AVEN_240023-1 [Araneus ventricosus]
MISADNSLEINKNFASGYENKRDDGSLSNVYLPENSPNGYPEMDNRFSERKDSNKLENNKRNSDSLRTVDITTESVAKSSFKGNENEDLNNNRRSMPSLRNVYITDEAISDAPESITSLNNQDGGVEYKIDKRNDMTAINLQGDGQSLEENSDSASNNINKDEYIASSSKKRNDNLMLRDTDSDNNQKFFPLSDKLVKNPRSPNKTKISQAVPKLTFYNEIQSSENSEISEFTSKKPSRLNTKRMTNDKFKSGRHQFYKRHKTKFGRDSLHHLEQKLEMEDHNLHQSLNPKTVRQSGESGKIHETFKDIFNSNEDDKISSNYQMREKQQNKSIDPQKIDDGSNDESVERDLLHDYTRNNQDINLKSKKSVESKTIKTLQDYSAKEGRDSFQVNVNDPNLSKKRSVDIRDVTTEKGSAIHFQRNFENQDESPDSPEMKSTGTTSKTVLRSSKNFNLKNRINNYNRQAFPHKKHLLLTSDTLSNRKSLHHRNPYYPYAEHKYSKYDSNERNQKRVPVYSCPTGLEVKELSGPHNYELNIAKQLNKKRAKVDEKISRTMEDYKVKKTILKDAKTRKETDIVENENEKVVDKVHVISDPNPKTPKPPPEPVNVPFVQEGPVYPSVDQDTVGEKESPEEEVAESDTGDLNEPPDRQIVAPSAAEEEELEQGEPQNAARVDYYGEESKEKVVSDNYYDIDADQEDEAAQKVPVSPSAENKAIPDQVDLNYGSETSEAYPETYDEDYSDDSQKSTEIPPAGEAKPMKVVNEYLPPAKLPLNLSPAQASMGQIYKASPPQPDLVFQDLKKSRLNQQLYKPHFGKGNKHKKIYHFSTEYAVSYGMDEFEKEEKLEKASKTVVRNKLLTANESSHHFQEKKTEIKNNKESYHEAYIEEKDESKFPREMDSSKNPQRSIPDSNHQSQSNDRNPNTYLDPDYPGSSADDNYSELVGNQVYDDQSGREYSGRISERFSPSDELKQHEKLIDNVKRSQPSLKINRDANTDSFTNSTQAQEKLHDGRRDASSLNRGDPDQEVDQKYSESNLEDSPDKNKEIRDSTKESKGSGTPSWTAPHSESKSGNVVYITVRTTTMDLEKKYHDFIQIQDDKRSPGRFERHLKQYRCKRKKNRITGNI